MWEENNNYLLERYNRRVNRTPKVWTIEKLYNLWLKVNERNAKRRNDSSLWMDEIVKNIPTQIGGGMRSDEEVRVIFSNYNNREGDDNIYKTIVGESTTFIGQQYTTSGGTVGDQSGSVLDNRDELVDSLMYMDEKLKYGNEYQRLSHLSRNYFSGWVMKHLWEKIREGLQEKYTTFRTPSIIPISICVDKWYVSAKVGNYPYIEFDLMCADTDEVNEF